VEVTVDVRDDGDAQGDPLSLKLLGRTATLLVLAVAWLAAAVLLVRTTVPAVDTGGLDVHRYFTSDQLARAHRYERFLRASWLLSLLGTIAALVVLVRRAPRIARGLELGPVSGGIVIGMVTLVTLWFVRLPFGLVDHWWAERHGLATGDYLAWLLEPWAQLGASAVYAMATIAIVIGLARRLGDRWWIVAAPLFVAMFASFAFVAGWIYVVDPKPVPPRFRDDVARLERAEHVGGTAVRVQKVSDVTNQVNAFAIGMGPSTRVFLWDTLLDGRFSDCEVRAVIAHELGHVHHRHVYKGVAWFALLAFPLVFAVARGTRRQGGMGNPGALPLAVLVVVLFGLVASPFENEVSRRYEAEADWSALEATRDPDAVSGVFEKFATTSLAEPNPPLWAYLLLENHPTIAQRIAMAEAWKRRNGR
jgi:STE24 endopeptidase